jgi:hypothetical protein
MRLETNAESSKNNQSREYKIRLTEPQRRWAEYAIAEMMALEFEPGENVLYLDGRTLAIPPSSEQAILAFLDVLENQVRDQSYADGVEYPRSAGTLARRVRAANEQGFLP